MIAVKWKWKTDRTQENERKLKKKWADDKRENNIDLGFLINKQMRFYKQHSVMFSIHSILKTKHDFLCIRAVVHIYLSVSTVLKNVYWFRSKFGQKTCSCKREKKWTNRIKTKSNTDTHTRGENWRQADKMVNVIKLNQFF